MLDPLLLQLLLTDHDSPWRGQDGARIYSRALSAGSPLELQNSSDLRGVLAAEWLGCRDDPGFLDAARRALAAVNGEVEAELHQGSSLEMIPAD